MSRLFDNYRTDATAEAKGVWVADSGCEFLLARMGGANTAYQRAMTQAMKPHMRELQLNMMDEATLEPLMRRVFLDTVLLDWRTPKDDGTYDEHTIPDENDLPVSFSKDAANALLNELPDLYARLREQAQSFANYRASALSVAAKN